MSAVEVSSDVEEFGLTSRAQPVQSARLVSTLARFSVWTVPLFLCLFCLAQAQDHSMRIMRNRTLVVTSYELVDPTNNVAVAPLYNVVLQKDPYIEIHLQNPVYRTQLNRFRQVFQCREVGVFRDARSKETWTIGKGCRPL